MTGQAQETRLAVWRRKGAGRQTQSTDFMPELSIHAGQTGDLVVPGAWGGREEPSLRFYREAGVLDPPGALNDVQPGKERDLS